MPGVIMANIFCERASWAALESANENSVLHLEGQGGCGRDAELVARAPRASGDAGYAMAALLVSIAVMSILMTVAMPVWKHAIQREKEADLLFRLGQYTRAIELYKRKHPNALPPNVDVLVQQKFLRKKYKDPITGGDFKFLSALEMQSAAGAPGTPPQRLPGREVAPGREVTMQIAGVASRSTATSIRIYKNRQRYDQWIVTPDEVFLRNRQSPGPVNPNQPNPGNTPGSRPGIGGSGTGPRGSGSGSSGSGSFPSGSSIGGQRPPGGQ
jgi:type II secretory pathway pseudopilin PulG